MHCHARGMTVTKRVSIDEQGLTRVRLELTSKYDVPVDVQVVDTISDPVGFEQVGVPDGPGEWRGFDDGSLVWAGRVVPDEPTVVQYGLLLLDPAAVATLEREPTIESVQRADAYDGRRDLAVDPESQPVDLQPVEALPSDERVPESVFAAVRDLSEAGDDDRPTTSEGLYRFEIAFADGDSSRQYSVVRELLNGTNVLQTDPALSTLEENPGDSTVEVVVCTRLPHPVVADALTSIDGVEHVSTTVLRERQPSERDGSARDSIQQTFESLRESVDTAAYDDLQDELAEAGFEARTQHREHDESDRIQFEELVADGAEPTDGLVDRLLDELEDGSVSEEERIALRRKLGFDPQRSTEVRIDYLQSRVERFAAYADAMEAFLDENGTGKEALEDLQTDLDALEAEHEALSSELTAEREDRERLHETVDAHEKELQRLDELESSLDSLRVDFEARAETVTGELRELRDAVDELAGAIEDVDGRLDDLEAQVSENAKVRQALAGLSD
ncbi:hypothetical protein [Haloarchaeobius sp. DT45]|uniref:hypothetical protein n=1 Tax=Haloarchaeobius sp. DT45 TaxID=3446116 RepID=UPI003F6CCE8A